MKPRIWVANTYLQKWWGGFHKNSFSSFPSFSLWGKQKIHILFWDLSPPCMRGWKLRLHIHFWTITGPSEIQNSIRFDSFIRWFKSVFLLACANWRVKILNEGESNLAFSWHIFFWTSAYFSEESRILSRSSRKGLFGKRKRKWRNAPSSYCSLLVGIALRRRQPLIKCLRIIPTPILILAQAEN